MKQTLFISLAALFVSLASYAQSIETKMVSHALSFLDVPYVANTLEMDGEEELVINCDEVDCTTFVEYVMALAKTPEQANGDISETAFAENLTKIRYRNGKIDGYTSRLHYVSDWINNGLRAPRSIARKTWIALNLKSPARSIGKMQMQTVHLKTCHHIYLTLKKIHGAEMT